MKKQISTEESIHRILITPLITRVNMPQYGSRLFELIDKSVDDEWMLDAISYVNDAVEINETRVSIKKVSITTGDTVSINIDYEEVESDLSNFININFSEVQNATA